jgi:hypothetical protein
MDFHHEDYQVTMPRRWIQMDSFIALWKNIANQHRFLRLTLPTDSPTQTDIRRAVKQQMGEMSPYSSDPYEDYLVVYHEGHTMLVTHRRFHSVGTFFAVPDSESPYRFFIGFAFVVGPMTESIAGLFVYFSEEGQKIEIGENVLFTYDIRNGYIRGKDGHLYRQSLFFTQSHRDTARMILYVHHVDYETDRINGHTMVYTDYMVREVHHRGRFLYFSHLTLPKYRVIDLGTLSLKEEDNQQERERGRNRERGRERKMTFSTYVVEAPSLDPFLDIATSFPERQYSDGYPLTCIRCHEPTHAANYGYKSSPLECYEMGLGNSYCPSCHIRYSLSRGTWLCTRVGHRGQMCESSITNTLDCPVGHLHSADNDCIVQQRPRQAKYPHRHIFILRWIPPNTSPASASLVHTPHPSPSSDSPASDSPASASLPSAPEEPIDISIFFSSPVVTVSAPSLETNDFYL